MLADWGMKRRQTACLVAGAVLLANSGCLLVAAGAGAAAAGAGYAYYKGKVCRTYSADHADVWAAAHAALAELGMQVEVVEPEAHPSAISSHTANGHRIRIEVDSQSGPVPADGMAMTKVCVRVATFGDEDLSQRLLDQIGYHLVPALPMGTPPVPMGPTNPASPVQQAGHRVPAMGPIPPETPPPPLLPREPVPVEKQD